MATAFPQIFAALAAPFQREEVRSRTAPGGRVLHYVTARSVMNRFDEVIGPESWWDDYEFVGQSACKCRLTVKLPDGSTVTKVGIGGVTAMPDESDSEKTGESDAFKRAAAKFGIGRYLYGDGIPRYVSIPGVTVGMPDPNRDGPAPAASPAPAEPPTQAPAQHPDRSPQTAAAASRPRTGKALFGWIRDQERIGHLRLMPLIVDWGRANGLPDRILDWDADQVRLAWREIKRHQNGEPEPLGHRAEKN